MSARRNNPDNNSSKQQERETRRQLKKDHEKKTYVKKNNDDAIFNNQLRAFNLQLRPIVGDGNCLFRSFADQMEGNQHRHAHYREKICDYMRANREDFEPFIVDKPFDGFIRDLSKDGTYGGNECIVAFSRLFDARICIHQLNQPVWTVCFSNDPTHEVHISYHNYEHYSSVRKLGDRSFESANIRQAMTTCNVTSTNEKSKSNKVHNAACAADSTELFDEHDVDYIESQITYPVDRQLIRDTLTDNHGDIDGTITYLLTLESLAPEPTPKPDRDPELNESLDKIISVTGIYDIDLVQESYLFNKCDVDSTVEALVSLKIDENKENDKIKEDENVESNMTNQDSKTKDQPTSNRQIKIDKKKAKKQRAMEKHRAQILAAAGKTPTKSTEEKVQPSNDEQEPPPAANMEYINI